MAAHLMAMANVFVDPAGTAKHVPRRASWLYPLLVVSIVTIALQWLNIPILMRVMQQNPPGNIRGEQMEQAMGMIAIWQKVGIILSPVLIAGVTALLALLLLVASTVTGITARFRDLFALLALCSLIPLLGQIAGFIVVRAKGDEIQTMEQLRPAFGLDLLLSAGANKQLLALLNYFSIFTVWYIVILGLVFAALTGASKAKSFLATSPVWFVPLLFVVGVSFLRG